MIFPESAAAPNWAEWDEDRSAFVKIANVKVFKNFIGYSTESYQHFCEEELSSDIRVNDIIKSKFNGAVCLVTETGTEKASVVQVDVANNGSFRLLTDSEIEQLSKCEIQCMLDSLSFIKKDNQIKFGDIVKLECNTLKIKESKLEELQEKYGCCLSRNQMQEVENENYENDIDSAFLGICYEDLEVSSTREIIGVISGINSLFGYYYNDYSIYTPGFGAGQFCINFEDKPTIRIDKFGVDFENFSVQTHPRIIKVLSTEEISKLQISNKQKEFYSDILKWI